MYELTEEQVDFVYNESQTEEFSVGSSPLGDFWNTGDFTEEDLISEEESEKTIALHKNHRKQYVNRLMEKYSHGN